MVSNPANIIATFNEATIREIEEGRQWYSRARLEAIRLDEHYDIGGSDVAAGVIAALSPRNKWARNVSNARHLIAAFNRGGPPEAESVRVGTFNRNKYKAIRILLGDDIREVLSGQKVVSFWECIMSIPGAVCVDGHAYSVWRGQRVTTELVPSMGPKLYRLIQEDYRKATAILNKRMGTSLIPSDVQAITWLAWRRIHAQTHTSDNSIEVGRIQQHLEA